MTFEHYRHPATGDYSVSLTLTEEELESIKCTGFDRALFKECEESNSIADKLLALEAVVRKIEEEYDKNNS